MALKFFGAVTQYFPGFGASGYTPAGYPDPNNKPFASGHATGSQFPWNIMRNDNMMNVIQASYTGYPGGSGYASWDAAAAATQSYCKANNVALMGAIYDLGAGAVGWSYLQTQLARLVPYLSGISAVYLTVINEAISTNASTPFVAINQSPFSDLGGAGRTGIDGLIQLIKNIRAMVGSNVKLGLNDFNILDQGSFSGAGKYQPAVNIYNTCKANGAAMDYVGAEGYWMATNYSGYSSPTVMLTTLCNNWGAATGGVPVFYSEFTPVKGTAYYPQPNQQIDTWQALLGAMSSNQYVIGVTGPWGGIRASTVWDGSSGEKCGGRGWMWNDTNGVPFAGEAPNNDPNGSGSIGPGTVTSTLSWLQSWVPANVTGGGGTTPMPESPDGTVVTNNSTSSITDANGASWTCTNGVVNRNGSPAAYSANVTQIEYHNHVVWQTNDAGGYWSWTGTAWTPGPNPNPPKPQPPTNLTTGTYAVPSGTQIIVP